MSNEKKLKNYKNYTEEQFINAVKTSTSIRQVLIKIGLAPKGGNYNSFKRNIERLSLDTSHFTGQAHNKNKTFGPKRCIEEYLKFDGIKIGSNRLKKRLISEKYFEAKCYNCGIVEWLNKPAPLELEHINGDNCDNRIDNLTILCPNCHAQTETYRGKNKKS